MFFFGNAQMEFTLQDRVEMCFIYAQVGENYRAASNEFNIRYPERPKPSDKTIRRTVQRFRETGSVLNRTRKRPKTATDDNIAVGVIANVLVDPHTTTRQIAADHGISQTSVIKILHAYKFHPYKMQLRHALNDNDPPQRLEFCTWAMEMIENDPTWSSNILFSDEALFYLNGKVNTQNYRYWADVNPHWMEGIKALNSPRLMVWCGIWGDVVVGPFFFEGTVTGAAYLAMLQGFLDDWLDDLPLLKRLRTWFQQDEASALFYKPVRDRLNVTSAGQWIGIGGPTAWPPRSTDITH